MSRPPHVPLERANNARLAARSARGWWLLALHEEKVTISDVIEEAATAEGSPLRSIPLSELISSSMGIGKNRSESLSEKIAEICRGDGCAQRNPTIGWLLDPRAGGRRMAAFADCLTPLRVHVPWEGFPWA